VTSYEWVVELVDAHGDISNVTHFTTKPEALSYASAPPPGFHYEIGLVRDVIGDDEDLEDRQWAYLENGKLPPHFDGGTPVPIHFLKQN
jgi:hypothetical protein